MFLGCTWYSENRRARPENRALGGEGESTSHLQRLEKEELPQGWGARAGSGGRLGYD
jgi:hypothetical protein